MSDIRDEQLDEAQDIAQEIIRIAMTSVLGDERDKSIRMAIIRHLTPTKGEPAVIKLITASDVIALLGYALGAIMDDAKDGTEPPRPIRRLRTVEDNLRALDDE